MQHSPSLLDSYSNSSTKRKPPMDDLADAPAESESPFLPGTSIQYAWDSTSIGYLKTCPRLYQYTMVEGWTQKHESVHLRFGIEFHKAIQDYEMSRAVGIGHEESVHDVASATLGRTVDWQSDHPNKNRATLLRTIVWYFEHYKDDPARTYVLANGKPAVEVNFRVALDFGISAHQPYLLCGHLDRIVTFNDEIFVIDHKTTTATPSSHAFDKYDPDNQMSVYSFAAGAVLHSPIRGVIIDLVQVLVDSNKFVRGFTYRTKDQLDEWIRDLRYWLLLAEVFATEGQWPMNDTACDKFGGCRFREVCSKSPHVRERFLHSTFEKGKPWNPLTPR
jgi:hypothetical protein